MTYRKLYFLTVFVPPLVIGTFEFLRHDWLLAYIPMETGNLLITIISFAISFLFASWVFRMIRRMNDRLVEEQARRAVYEERERLARELHDGIAQSLFFLNVKLRQGHVNEARAAVSEIDKHVRQAIFNLRALPEEGSFPQRLEKWLTQWSSLTGVDVDCLMEIPESTFSPAEEVQLFGIVQEAFANIRKHAAASHATLTLQVKAERQWKLVITDNGSGFDQGAISADHYGIVMMRERAEKLGAMFSLSSQQSGGTMLSLHSK
ncbi:sensor histidine kinase [Brevibacillus migulae]|uniref:sensor histidine kinase n=1 Tax=Brevibacillus migulae TaxID=1644114 RepID=UPI00106E9A34|nr:histidine kinase [Brevibacillus migulae]